MSSDVSDRNRVPAGVHEGGQFAIGARAEADVTLGEPPSRLPREVARGMHDVANTFVEVSDLVRDRVAESHLSARRDLRARFEAAALRMQLDEQTDTIENELVRLQGRPVTLLLADSSGSVQAYEGRLGLDLAGQPCLFVKGSKSRRVVLRHNAQPYGRPRPDPRVLAVRPGYGYARGLTERFDHHLSKTPELEPATADGIPVDDGTEHDEVAAVFVFHHPGFDGDQDGRGSLFFATDITASGDEDAIDDEAAVNGYAVFAPSSGLVSEHGSMYLGDLKSTGGRVKGYRPSSMTFRDAMELARYVEDADDIQLAWEKLV